MSHTDIMIAHLTTAHPRDDTRIRLKEVATLARAFDCQVALFVQDGQGDEVDAAGYRIVDTGPPLSRLPRLTRGGWRMISSVLRTRPAVAHFHDPELLPWSLLLLPFGIKVIYDVHEDVPRQVRHSPNFPSWLRRLLPNAVSIAEWFGARFLTGLVTATPEIAGRFPARKTTLVQNYAMIGELHIPDQTPMSARPRDFAYVGGIGVDRGIIPMLEALDRLPEPGARLNIAGSFSVAREQVQAEAHGGWNRVRFLGLKSRNEVAALLSRARAGLVLFQPRPNNIAGRPNKLFEYMSAGLPVIASDYPRWREIVSGAGCGLLVDPEDPDAIAEAMQWFLDNPQDAQAMGESGRQAILDRFNWDREAEKLIALYEVLLPKSVGRRR